MIQDEHKTAKKELFPEPAPATAPARACDAPGFWPALYLGTFALGLATSGAGPLSPLCATVGLMGVHVCFW